MRKTAALLEKRQISSEELVKQYLTRIEEADPQINAFITCSGEEALAQARDAIGAGPGGKPFPLGMVYPLL